MRRRGFLMALAAGAAAPALIGAARREPILDMHLHAREAGYIGPNPPPLCTPFKVMPRWDPRAPGDPGLVFNEEPCADPAPAGTSTEQIMQDTLAIMRRRNIVGMVSGDPELMAVWRKADTEGRIIPGLDLRLKDDGPRKARSPEEARRLLTEGGFRVLGEVMAQYEGVAADDPRLEPYWALAEELDIPVGIHMGPGGPGDPYFGAPGYRAGLGSPFRIEEVLVRHPKARVYLMHAAYPFLEELRSVMFAHPQLYVDTASIDYTEPRPAFWRWLEGLVEAGYGDRVMFGSDQMIWPGTIEPAIAAIEDAPFLSAAAKRDILYNNAARFLRLTPAEIARHHAL